MSTADDRWEAGMAHHPVAKAIYDLVSLADLTHGGDRECWKSGGDGDNGEHMMLGLSALVEAEPDVLVLLQDALNETRRRDTE
jgi:hypothetical protein